MKTLPAQCIGCGHEHQNQSKSNNYQSAPLPITNHIDWTQKNFNEINPKCMTHGLLLEDRRTRPQTTNDSWQTAQGWTIKTHSPSTRIKNVGRKHTQMHNLSKARRKGSSGVKKLHDCCPSGSCLLVSWQHGDSKDTNHKYLWWLWLEKSKSGSPGAPRGFRRTCMICVEQWQQCLLLGPIGLLGLIPDCLLFAANISCSQTSTGHDRLSQSVQGTNKIWGPHWTGFRLHEWLRKRKQALSSAHSHWGAHHTKAKIAFALA